ncbi:MAG: YEATS-associated helix-containing protein [Flavobacterium sp.]
MNQHYLIIIVIILVVGSFAGFTNYLNFYFKNLVKSKYEIFKYIISGIGAAILVPLLLNMLSSDLVQESENYNILNYFVFAGFCYIAGYFSDRFITSIGDKVLKDLEETKEKVEKVENATKVNQETINFIVSAETEADGLESTRKDFQKLNIKKAFGDDAIQNQQNKIIDSFSGKFKFRTLKGISKYINDDEVVTKTKLEDLEHRGIIKKLDRADGEDLYALTKFGIMHPETEREDKE